MDNISKIISSLSAIILTGVALYGLREWKRQLKGKTDYEIARRYLKAALQMRDAIKFVRNPFIWMSEMQAALKEHGFDSDEHENTKKTNRVVYSSRWKKVQEARTNLEAELLEAEVSWGAAAIDAQKNLDNLTKELFAALQLFLDGDVKGNNTEYKLIYAVVTEDEFSVKIDAAIEEIRNFLKPHFK